MARKALKARTTGLFCKLVIGLLATSYTAGLVAQQPGYKTGDAGALAQTVWSAGDSARYRDFDAKSYMQEVQLIGAGTFEFAFWSIYDVNLYSHTESYQPGQPFALELVYHRSFKGREIADRSVDLIRQQGFDDEVKLASWHNQMAKLFPNVEKGTRLTGIHTPQGHALFVLDGKPLGEIRDRNFARYFFDIWLGPETKAPKLRAQLLGPPENANLSR